MALSQYEAVCGTEHQNVAVCHENIGAVCRKQGNLNEAKEHIFKALEIGQATCGEIHRDTAGYYKDLGEIYEQLGDSSKASEYMKKAETISNLLAEKDAAT